MNPKYSRQRRYHQKHPWVKFVSWARRRCSGKDSDWKPYYFDRGIRCRIDSSDTQRIWIRDSGGQLRRPSLDRVDSKADYCVSNIRFIEFKDNVRLAQENRRLNK